MPERTRNLLTVAFIVIAAVLYIAIGALAWLLTLCLGVIAPQGLARLWS